MLLKLERKLDLDDLVNEWNSQKTEGLFDWLKVLSKIDDEKLIKVCGTDVALYLVYLRYSSQFFGIISMMNVFFIILYLTGSPLPEDNFRLDHKRAQYAMQALTILNVTASPIKVTICFLYSMIIIPGLTLCLLLLYLTKFQENATGGQRTSAVNASAVGAVSEQDFASPYKLIDILQLQRDPSLLDDRDMGERLYTELDIAEQTIML